MDEKEAVDETKAIIDNGGHKIEWMLKEMDQKDEKTFSMMVIKTC